MRQGRHNCAAQGWTAALDGSTMRTYFRLIATAFVGITALAHHAPVAQLDRVVASEAIGQRFESSRARQLDQRLIK
jgi:hypothetical protein